MTRLGGVLVEIMTPRPLRLVPKLKLARLLKLKRLVLTAPVFFELLLHAEEVFLQLKAKCGRTRVFLTEAGSSLLAWPFQCSSPAQMAQGCP